MATEALDLPRNATIAVRLPHQVRVILRAMRIANARRRAAFANPLGYFDEYAPPRRQHDQRYDWLSALVWQHGRGI